jgi:hypothetical protein
MAPGGIFVLHNVWMLTIFAMVFIDFIVAISRSPAYILTTWIKNRIMPLPLLGQE